MWLKVGGKVTTRREPPFQIRFVLYLSTQLLVGSTSSPPDGSD